MGVRAAALAWRGGSVAGDREEPLQQALEVVLAGTSLQHVDDSRSLQDYRTQWLHWRWQHEHAFPFVA